MKKKLAFLAGILLFSGFLFFWMQQMKVIPQPGSLSFGAYAGEVRQAASLQKRFPATLDARQIRLCFRGEELACHREEKLWYLPVDMDTKTWEEGSFTDAGGRIRLLPLQDYTLLDKEKAVAQGTHIPFLAWDEKEGVCQVVYVVFTGLPVVRMETTADLDVDTVFAGSVVFYQACDRKDWTLTSVFRAHERGQTTRAYPKRGYRVDLITLTSTGVMNKNRESVLGMRKSDSWIFYAIYSDGTKIRDKFNTELWNRFGAKGPDEAHFGTHMEYAELVANGEYRGLYGILEPIDTQQLQISDQEYLYKRNYGRELLPELMEELTPEEYLSGLGMEIKGKDGAGTRADWDCFRQFAELCQEDDETFRKRALGLVDLDSVANLWIYLQLTNAGDNVYKNMFFAFKNGPEGHRMYLVPWDMDLTWGNVYVDNSEALYVTWCPENVDQYLEWPFADRLIRLDVGGIRHRIAERWQELRETVFSQRELDDLFWQCRHRIEDSGVLAREAERWPQGRWDGDYDSMYDYMEERVDWMDVWVKEHLLAGGRGNPTS